MMEEAARRGHELFVLHQEDILCRDGVVSGIACAAHGSPETKQAWYRWARRREAPLSAFDAVLMRKDPPFDMEYVYSTYLLELARSCRARASSTVRGALRDYNEKIFHHALRPVHRRRPWSPGWSARSARSSTRTATSCSSRWTAWAARRCSACTARTPTSAS